MAEISENVSFLYIALDNQFDVIAINKFALHFYNWGEKEVISHNLFKLYLQKKIKTILSKKLVEQCALAGGTVVDHVSFCGSDKKAIVWHFDTGLNCHKFIMIGMLVSEDDLIPTSYRNTSIYLKNVVDNVPHYIFWKDKDSVFLGCNKIFAESAGLADSKEIIGKTDYDLPWGNFEADEYRRYDQEVIKSGRPKLNIEETQTTKDGKQIVLLTSKVPLTNNQGDVLGVLAIYTDITDRKNMEMELIKSKQQAEIANLSKSEFIANMSHDLRTPITGMLGLVQDMINTADEAQASLQKQQENNVQNKQSETNSILANIITKIQSDGNLLMGATDELLQLCNEVLEVVCLETGKSSEQLESFNFHQLMQHNIELLQPTAQHKKLNLSYEIAADVPTFLKGLAIYLDRSLLNLISNALKFTEKGFVKITARLVGPNLKTHKVGDAVTLQITVEDSGIGIPKDKFDTIFDHFSRLTSSYQGVYKGAGLGLYTVKRYIEAMQGKITLNSDVGKGACFTLTLPFTVADHADRKKQPYRSSKPVTPALDVKADQPAISKEKATGSVLLVEDSMLAARAVRAALTSFGCGVDVAETGEQGVTMARNNPYDLVLMDIGLPDFTGVEATKKIRALSDPEKANVPIVALTGHAGNPDKRQEALNAGMQEVLNKPAQRLALELILNCYVFKKSGAQPAKPISADNATFDCAVLDWNACVRMCQDDPDMAWELLSLLASDLKETAPLLANDYANKNTRALRDALHRLCGSVCYLKVPQLENALKIFQEAVKAEPQNPQHLQKTHTEVQQAITVFLQTWEKVL